MTDTTTLQNAYHECAVLTRQRARNFYFGLRLTPRPKRSALYAAYAWMRRADDIVDQPDSDEDTARELEQFKNRTIGLFQNGSSRVPEDDPTHASLWIAFADTVRRYPVRLEDLLAMIDGQQADRAVKRYETFHDLEKYCFNVASTVGFVCMAIWGYSGGENETRRLARDHGIAFQLTNIIRDFAEDRARDRIYLPVEDFRRFNCTHADLAQWSNPTACRAFVNFQIDRARRYYDDSAPLESIVHPDGLPAYLAMTRIYRDLLERIADDPFPCFTGRRRAAVPTIRKLSHALHARLAPLSLK